MSQLSAMFGFDAANNSAKAAEKQGKRNSRIAGGYENLWDSAMPMASDFFGGLNSVNALGGVKAGLNSLNAGPGARIDAYGAGATEAASKNAMAANDMMRAQGYGDGAAAGAGAGFFQGAAADTNAFASREYSPEGELARIQAYLQTLGMSAGTITNILAALSSGIYGQPQQQVQQNPLAALLGGAASAYTSGLAGAAGRKAGA